MMTALEKSIYQEITEKLKGAPKSILEQVLGYVDSVLENKTNANFNDLNGQIQEDYANYKSGKSELLDIDDVEKEIKNFISENEN
ncbi:hypothetical protein ACFO4P_01840 [Epilithonimonas pallida]|uniref:Addiction module component n=1 Tax=Epilithonimonas pallida TaxID=373671 RepID=A0ABY1R282_9FLAO|nr:hypothetical protein [Epilithonimonas pallida]SMP91753.1 hypothetical protein SAMN05421679_103258 [Epilithonimonas pallida]